VNDKKLFYFIALISILMAILFGLIAVTINPIIISLAVALIVGVILLAKVDWIVWSILSLGLLVVGLLPLFFDFFASKAAWGVSLLGSVLMLIALMKIVMTPDARKNTPAFVWIALAFIVYALIVSLVQWHSFWETISGFKRYFQAWGLLFVLCWMTFNKQQVHNWKIFFLFVALLQLPFAIYERIVYVPIREGIMHLYPGMVPIDVVGGTFGASITGGGASAEMVAFLVVVLAFLVARRKEKLLSNSKFFLFALIILAPLWLSEVKAIIVMLPLIFLTIYRGDMLVQFHYKLIGFAAITAFIVVASYAYLFSMSQNQSNGRSMDKYIEDTLAYNLYDKGHANNVLNRRTVLSFWIEKQGLHDPISFVFGNGLGSAHFTGGHVFMRYPSYGIGLTGASTLLWETGFLGFCIFVTILVSAWISAERLRRQTNKPEIRADATAIQAALAVFGFCFFYRMGILEVIGFQILFATLLGYLGWMHCVGVRESN